MREGNVKKVFLSAELLNLQVLLFPIKSMVTIISRKLVLSGALCNRMPRIPGDHPEPECSMCCLTSMLGLLH